MVESWRHWPRVAEGRGEASVEGPLIQFGGERGGWQAGQSETAPAGKLSCSRYFISRIYRTGGRVFSRAKRAAPDAPWDPQPGEFDLRATRRSYVLARRVAAILSIAWSDRRFFSFCREAGCTDSSRGGFSGLASLPPECLRNLRQRVGRSEFFSIFCSRISVYELSFVSFWPAVLD